MQRAQALNNLTSTFKKKDEANAVDAGPKGKGKSKGRGKGKGKGGGRGGKGAKDSPSGYNNTSPPVCHRFLAGKDCSWGDECRYEHVTQKQLDVREKKKKTKKKTKKKSKKDETSDSSADEKSKRNETPEQKAKRRKKLPCYAYSQTGACSDGKKCQYNHVAASGSDDSSESSNHVSCITGDKPWAGERTLRSL